MILRRLAVAKFRNLDRQRIEFCGGINCLYGRNGQGKSNVLEAVYYLAHLRSFRAGSSDELVRWGEDVLLLEGAVEGEGGQRTRLFASYGGGARRLNVNGRPIVRTLDFRRHLHIGFFSSQALSLVSGGPEERRRFLEGLDRCAIQPFKAGVEAGEHWVNRQSRPGGCYSDVS